MIYLVAVVADKTDPEHTPFVSVPLGPYQPSESCALGRGRISLEQMYNTDDIRRVEPEHDYVDLTWVRAQVLCVVTQEAQDRREAAHAARAGEALGALGEERWEPRHAIIGHWEDV